MPGWAKLQDEAEKKIASHRKMWTGLIFRSRTELDPLEIEYYRGFEQGVEWILQGLPAAVKRELQEELSKQKEHSVRG